MEERKEGGKARGKGEGRNAHESDANVDNKRVEEGVKRAVTRD